jgi:hypothetical protein
MVDYCGDGSWNIYSISSAGSIIHTIQRNVTSTRATTDISMTLKGATLTFSIDTETHTANNISPLTPTKMAIVYFDSNYSGTCCFNWHITVTNFGYTPLTA